MFTKSSGLCPVYVAGPRPAISFLRAGALRNTGAIVRFLYQYIAPVCDRCLPNLKDSVLIMYQVIEFLAGPRPAISFLRAGALRNTGAIVAYKWWATINSIEIIQHIT